MKADKLAAVLTAVERYNKVAGVLPESPVGHVEEAMDVDGGEQPDWNSEGASDDE